MTGGLRFRVEAAEAGRVDRIVAARWPATSRAELAALFRRGAVRVDGVVAKKGRFAAAGSSVELCETPPGPEDRRPLPDADPELALLYEDAGLLAIAKPAGMPSHPLRAGERGTAANALVARDPALARVGRDPREAGLVHRLDTGTSGVLVAARTQTAWEALRRELSRRRAIKSYRALVCGAIGDRGQIAAPLGQRAGRAVVTKEGKPARTDWEVLARKGPYALLSCVARTGRMHQIRAHVAHAGAPILGDGLYGGEAADHLGLIGHFLHARAIALSHPHSGERLDIRAPMPTDRASALARLGFQLD